VLPEGDFTPASFAITVPEQLEWLKRPVRRFAYPVLNAINHYGLAARYASDAFKPDLWLWGQRGNDYERHRRRVNSFLPLRGARILIAGCGTGRDLASWVAWSPAKVLAADWFSYDRAWACWRERFAATTPGTEVRFMQADLAQLSELDDASLDVVGSDAVFEHLKDLPAVLNEFRRILRPGGIMYATFGPLWYGWGGDHVSGYDAIGSGFNHIHLPHEEWLRYVDAASGQEHSEHDGRTWIRHDLFSRLRTDQYLQYLESAGFERLFASAIVDPRAVAALDHFPNLRASLLKQHALRDLLVCGMTLIGRRP
jgi:SAM-dependent methyltransferase